LGLSALLTTALEEMRNTLDELRTVGVKTNLRVLLGGNAVKKEFGAEIGADATALDAVEGLEICKEWLKK
jgi:5-methyltetrahydrofolate--homocysteine methyltransferase